MSEDTISRKAVVDICNNAIDLWHGQLGEGIVIAVKKKIKELPPAQPEIIRCLECTWYHVLIEPQYVEYCELTECTVFMNDFCSRAERKTYE